MTEDSYTTTEGQLMGCQRCADLSEALQRLVSLARSSGLESGVLDEAERFLKECPLNEALVQVCADICEGRDRLPDGRAIVTYDDMLEAARRKLKS
jgi:hypothetical protein